ncbi:MAG TPA: lipase maturation factor family protein [Steroidobacteraceae bacterium]|jgi:predicted DCC family thiol-disulfide oxidoreductase YuxK|nr:lipase maturation factor family protein [Steroidobacteraceae bacterium]
MGDLSADSRPLLVFDADCAFCVYWARYWRKLTGDAVDYQPYQEVASQHPQIPLAEFQRAVQYITHDGRRASAAEASFLTLSHARGKGFWFTLYKKLPGFAAIAEWIYAFIAAHRSAFYRITLLLWGRNYQPPRYDLVCFVFLRMIGLVYLSAFVSFGVQAVGLIGSHGILPIAELAQVISSHAGTERFYAMPMLFWINASDLAIRLVCWAGAGFSLLLIFNVLPRLSLLALYVLYLSLLYAGQTFMSFQWDTFLLEAGFLSLLLSFAPTPGIWLLRWLLFRFMFMSGVVKLSSGDPHWWDLSALSYHFFTQPLPTPLAWYAAHLPTALLRFATGGLFLVELVLPFLIFCPRRLRFCAGLGILLLQSCILITGNYNWFNLQTMLLCLLLFDDAAFQKCLPRRVVQVLSRRVPLRSSKAASIVVGAWGLVLVFVSLVQMDDRFGGSPPMALRAIDQWIEPMRMVSSYGLFAVMTTERNEIIIEGSDDGVEWREYGFPYKPGDVARRPPWNIPHQPRLDWQMWFAALDDPRRVDWFPHFLERLLQNEPTVTALLAGNPFAEKAPRYIRAQFYSYTFSSAEEMRKGFWWQRRSMGLYFPVVQLKAN